MYRSPVRPSGGLHLAPDGGESSKTSNTIIHVKSRQDKDQSATKPMPSYDPYSLIGRTFLLPKENGECLRATISEKIIETSQELDDIHDNTVDNVIFLIGVGQGRSETILSYN